MFAQDFQRAKWRCIHFVRGAELPSLSKELQAGGYCVRTIPGTDITSQAALLDAIAKAFSFPSYFGRNRDALNDCLRDMSWLPAKGYLLVVEDATSLWRNATLAAGGLVEQWLFCAEEWNRRGVPFHLAFSV